MSKLIDELNKDADAVAIDKRFGVGVLQGIWVGVSLAVLLLMCGAIIPAVWHWSSSITTPATPAVTAKPQQLELVTVYSNVPFVPLSRSAVRYGLKDADGRRLMEREMMSRFYFEQEALRGGTRYIPQLRVSSDAYSIITLTNGTIKEAVVQLLKDDGSPGRYGLIPFEEYEDDLSGSRK